MSGPLDYLARVLLARIHVLLVHVRRHGGGYAIREGIVATPRLILVTKGRVIYRVEDRAVTLRRGMMILVPAHARRVWRVPRGARFEMAWVEYETEPALTSPGEVLIAEGCDFRLESTTFERLLAWHALAGKGPSLRAEGEFKALLARFLSTAAMRAPSGRTSGRGYGEQGVRQALAWLSAHFREPEALEGLAERAGLSPNHFRLRFKRLLGSSPQAYLTTLRMRAARAGLRESALSIKEVAHSVGYRDPLYFSRLYRAYWKRPPSQDRALSP